MKKKLVSVFLVVALVAIAAMGTLAYFTDSDEVANTFTVGKVDIMLTEQDGTNEDGIRYEQPIMPGVVFEKDPTITVVDGSEECYVFLDVTLNKHKSLIPVMAQNAGIETDKYLNSENRFSTSTFLNDLMTNDMAKFRAIVDQWFVGISHADWKIVDFFYDVDKADVTKDGNYMTIRFAYIGGSKGTLVANDSVTFMESFQMPATVTSEMLSNEATGVNAFNSDNEPFHLNFKAYAIQAAEIDNVADAQTALFN